MESGAGKETGEKGISGRDVGWDADDESDGSCRYRSSNWRCLSMALLRQKRMLSSSLTVRM